MPLLSRHGQVGPKKTKTPTKTPSLHQGVEGFIKSSVLCQHLDFDSCCCTVLKEKKKKEAAQTTLFLYKKGKTNHWVFNDTEAQLNSKVFTYTEVHLVFASDWVAVIAQWPTSTCCSLKMTTSCSSEQRHFQQFNKHFHVPCMIMRTRAHIRSSQRWKWSDSYQACSNLICFAKDGPAHESMVQRMMAHSARMRPSIHVVCLSHASSTR